MATVHALMRDFNRQQKLISPVVMSPVISQIMKNSEITRGIVGVKPFGLQFKTINLTAGAMLGHHGMFRLIAENTILRDMFRGVVFDYTRFTYAGSTTAEPWDAEPDAPQTPDAQATSTAAGVVETFNWLSRYEESFSTKPDLTDAEKKIFVIWLASFVTLCVFILEHQCPAVGNEVQRIDATAGGGMLLFALMSVFLKRK